MATTAGHTYGQVTVNGGNVVNGNYVVTNIRALVTTQEYADNLEELKQAILRSTYQYQSLSERLAIVEHSLPSDEEPNRVTEEADNEDSLHLPPGCPPTADVLKQQLSTLNDQYLLRTYLASLSLDSVSLAPSMQVSSLGSSSSSDSASFISAQEYQPVPRVARGRMPLTTRTQIFVRGVPGMRSILLNVDLDERVLEIESKIRACRHLPKFHFRLSYRGRTLDAFDTMRLIRLKPLTTLYCRPALLSRGLIERPHDCLSPSCTFGHMHDLYAYIASDQLRHLLRIEHQDATFKVLMSSDLSVVKMDKALRKGPVARFHFPRNRQMLDRFTLTLLGPDPQYDGSWMQSWRIEDFVWDELLMTTSILVTSKIFRNVAEEVLEQSVINEDVEIGRFRVVKSLSDTAKLCCPAQSR